MSKQEISQELLQKAWEENKEEILEILRGGLDKFSKGKFEVEVPELYGKYYLDDEGGVTEIWIDAMWTTNYQRGLVFDTEEEAERYDKERILLFKIKKWAEIQNKGWKASKYNTFYYIYHNKDNNELRVDYQCSSNYLSKLPYFKTEEIARAFINEFGDEILEVLC